MRLFKLLIMNKNHFLKIVLTSLYEDTIVLNKLFKNLLKKYGGVNSDSMGYGILTYVNKVKCANIYNIIHKIGSSKFSPIRVADNNLGIILKKDNLSVEENEFIDERKSVIQNYLLVF